MLLSKRKFQLLQQMFKVPYRPSNQKYNSEEIELIKFSNYLSKHLYNNSSTILTPSHRKSSLKDVTIEGNEKKSSFPSYDLSNINSNINYSIDDIGSPQIYYNLSKEIIIENPEEVIQSGCLNGSLTKKNVATTSNIYEDLDENINFNQIPASNINMNNNININNLEGKNINQINNAVENNDIENRDNINVSTLIPGKLVETVKLDIPKDKISSAENKSIEATNEELNQKENEEPVENVPDNTTKKYKITNNGNVVVVPDNYSTDDEDEFKAITTLNEDLSSWQNKLDKDGVKIYFKPFAVKDDKGNDTESVKCFCDILLDFPASTVISKLNDFSFRQKMDELYEKGKILNEKTIEDNIKVMEMYLYLKMPFIFADRDFVVERKCWLDYNGNKDHALFYLHSIENSNYPAKEKPVRATFEYKSMYIKPLGANQCQMYLVTAMNLNLSVSSSTLIKSGQEKQEKWIKNLKKELK